MAKTKAELLEEAKKLGIEVDEKAKVAEIKALIDDAGDKGAETATEEEVEDTATSAETDDVQVAKAGKRSAKALREDEERRAKEERKASGEASAQPQKAPIKPARSRLERRAKGYRKSAEKVEKDKPYSLQEAVKLAKSTSHVKFDATVELHVNLSVDPRQADQNVRDTLVLPAGTGKSVKIAVFTEDAAAAKKAGAALAGTDEIIALLEKGTTDFDILIATPQLMPQLGKYARVLGPRGLMPNPKSGTVTTDIDKAVAEAKAGRVEYRVDSTGIVHLGIGKVSFDEQQLLDNINAVMTSIKNNKPASVKGAYIQRAYLTTSMGPSIAVNTADVA
ncbi:MAG TPA: 50S ribosomal protein L1 [Candidatus Saccharimonadales bacterium]|nr:50S ribosomal protein L1 [Candidatus Saccharimonadales bacterium]